MPQANPYITLEIDITTEGPPIGDKGQRLPVTQTTTHRYDDLRSAFLHMMTIDIYRLDRDFCQRKGADGHYSKVCIRDEQREELVEMVCLRDHSRHFRVPEPGIYLYVLMGIEELEQATRIDLGELEYYHDAENYLLLANFNRSYDRLIPGKGYTELTAAIREAVFVPTCPDPVAPYQLTIEGLNYGNPPIQGEMQDCREYLWRQRYPSLEDAFAALLERNVHCFHATVAARHQDQHYYDTAIIEDTRNNNTIVEVFHINFVDSPDGQPMAGIYLQFPQGIEPFQQQTGYSFAGIEGYDANVSHLLAAVYRYDEKGYDVTPSPTFERFTKDLLAGAFMERDRDAWNYSLQIEARHSDDRSSEPGKGQYQRQHYACHYGRLADALHSLLSIDLYQLDEELCHRHGLHTYVTNAAVHDWEGNKIAALAAANKTSVAPGIYLQVPAGFQQLQQDEGIDLSLLRYQDLEFRRQLPGTDHQQAIAVYTADKEYLLINEGVALGKDWLLEHPQEQGQGHENEPTYTSTAHPDPAAEKMPFSLRILWNSSPAKGEGHYIEPVPVVAHFPDFASAFGALQECEPHFRPPGNLSAGYINHASILDNGDGGEILRKFAPPPQRADDIDGTCIRLNQSKINLDILKTIREHFVAVGEPEAIHHLVYRSRKKDGAAQSPLSRQPPHTSREIKDLPGKGMAR